MSQPIAKTTQPPTTAVMVRQHTPIQMGVDAPNRMISLHVVGDRSAVVLGLTESSGLRLIDEVRRALNDLASQ